MTDDTWAVDDTPSGRYPLYTRGNVGEVFPTVVSPLTWSLFGPEAEGGWRDAFNRFGAFTDGDYGTEPKVILGVFGGYCYLNMSLIRLFAVRTPGLTVEALDRQFFGEAEAPPYVSQPGDRDLRASLRVGRTLLRTLRAKALPELEQDKADVQRWRAGLGDPATASDRDLAKVVRDYRPMFRRLFDHHIHVTFQATVGPGIVQQICAEKLGDPGLPVTLLGGIGDVESAEPAARLWELGRMVAAEPELGRLFDGGLDGLEERLAQAPAADRFRKELAAFTLEFGSRGPNEWEGSSPTWGTTPALCLAAIDCMRGTSPDHDPRRMRAELERRRIEATATARARLHGATRLQFDMGLRSAALFSQGRERSKTTIIRSLHETRVRQLELARRCRDRGGPRDLADMWLIADEELDDFIASPGRWADTIAERAAQRDRLSGLVPPFVFDGTQPPPTTWARAGEVVAGATIGTELQGIAGCPGIARGRARVVLDPIDPRGLAPGEVLVAPITDPSWTPLFLSAEAVVVDVGAQMSHAVIVARELGIPAVVSVTDATRRIADGTMLEVDGNAGVVRVLANGG